MSRETNAALTEHTLNIRAGLSTLKTKYGLTLDEYDYLDIAVDALRDIRHFGTTSYIGMSRVGEDGKIDIPCFADSIDAVTTRKMAKKAFSDRVPIKLYNERFDADDFYSFTTNITAQGIGTYKSSIYTDIPGLAYRRDPGYIDYTLEGRHIFVDKSKEGQSIGIAFTGFSVDIEGFSLITRKQANALAAISAKYIALRGAARGNKGLIGLLELYTAEAGRLKQAASIAETISDNEIDDLLNAKTTFNRKAVNRPTKYGR